MDPRPLQGRPENLPASAELGENFFQKAEGQELDENVSLDDLRHAWEQMGNEAPSPVIIPSLLSIPRPSPAPAASVQPGPRHYFPMAPEMPASALPGHLNQPPRPSSTATASPESLEQLSTLMQRVEAMVRDLHQHHRTPSETAPPPPAPPTLEQEPASPLQILAEGMVQLVSSLHTLTVMTVRPLPAPKKKKLFGKPDFSAAEGQWNAQHDYLRAVLNRAEQVLREAGVKPEP